MVTWTTLRDAGLIIMLVAIFVEMEQIHSVANAIVFYTGGAAYIVGAARAMRSNGK